MQSRGFINVSELNFLHGVCFGTSVDEKCKLSVNFNLSGQLVKMEIFKLSLQILCPHS